MNLMSDYKSFKILNKDPRPCFKSITRCHLPTVLWYTYNWVEMSNSLYTCTRSRLSAKATFDFYEKYPTGNTTMSAAI